MINMTWGTNWHSRQYQLQYGENAEHHRKIKEGERLTNLPMHCVKRKKDGQIQPGIIFAHEVEEGVERCLRCDNKLTEISSDQIEPIISSDKDQGYTYLDCNHDSECLWGKRDLFYKRRTS